MPLQMQMQVTIIDGYTDEPALLGVPPYLAPTPRYLASVVTATEHSYTYLTIDQLRTEPQLQQHIANAQLVVIIAGAIVPGKYLRGMPISKNEVLTLLERFSNDRRMILGGKSYGHRWCTDRRFGDHDFQVVKKDLDAAVYDLLSTGDLTDRYRTMEE